MDDKNIPWEARCGTYSPSSCERQEKEKTNTRDGEMELEATVCELSEAAYLAGKEGGDAGSG